VYVPLYLYSHSYSDRLKGLIDIMWIVHVVIAFHDWYDWKGSRASDGLREKWVKSWIKIPNFSYCHVTTRLPLWKTPHPQCLWDFVNNWNFRASYAGGVFKKLEVTKLMTCAITKRFSTVEYLEKC